MLNRLRTFLRRRFDYSVSLTMGRFKSSDSLTEQANIVEAPVIYGDEQLQAQPTSYLPELLNHACMQWQDGEWEKLVRLDKHTIEHHPDRAHLALVIGSAWQQLNDHVAARYFIKQAKEWGCDKKLIAVVLVAGVHNTLGRIAMIKQDGNHALDHFKSAVKGVNGSLKGADDIKALRILSQLGLLQQTDQLLHKQKNGVAVQSFYISFRVPESKEAHPTKSVKSFASIFHSKLLDKPIIPLEISECGEPIFIHSLWRSGSTYFFQVFRRSSYRYWAYQEPVHEAVLPAKANPEILNRYISDNYKELRHPQLDKPYYFELSQTHHAWYEILKKEMILDDYFSTNAKDSVTRYFEALIVAAKGRPVIQECRTSNRIGTIKQVIGGKHLYLWRNPWDQWWSFKVDPYFDTVCQLILGAHSAPPAIYRIKEEIDYAEFHHEDMREELRHFQQMPLSSQQSYLVFYMLWCLALLEGISNADLMINMDRLSTSEQYCRNILDGLKSLGILGINLSDCNMPQTYFGQNDIEFFSAVEHRVHTILLETGISGQSVMLLKRMQSDYAPQRINDDCKSLARDLQRTREIIIRLESASADRAKLYLASLAVLSQSREIE